MLERLFKIRQSGSTLRTEITAGITTFMTMAYILAVNPDILSATGMDKGALFTSTALVSAMGCLFMAFIANLPFAMAPGMGLNAFFTYTVVLGMGHSWQTALGAIFLEGLIFLLLSFLNVREAIINGIPMVLKKSISVGIGLFIALVGFKNAGIIVGNNATLVSLGDLSQPSVYLSLLGLVLMGVLLFFRVKSALLLGIVAITLIGIPLGVSLYPGGHMVTMPPSIRPIFMQIDFRQVFHPDILVVVFTFLFVDMFDTVGTLVGVSQKANMINKSGKVLRAKQALISDSLATTFGSLMGSSTVTTYVESASGVATGGRTGFTSVITAMCFILALFLSAEFMMIPSAATSPALIMVGLFMITPITTIEFSKYLDAIPAFLTILLMPLTFSISEGIIFGILFYVLLRVISLKFKDLSWILVILSIIFTIKLLVDIMR